MPVMDGIEATKQYREYEKTHPHVEDTIEHIEDGLINTIVTLNGTRSNPGTGCSSLQSSTKSMDRSMFSNKSSNIRNTDNGSIMEKTIDDSMLANEYAAAAGDLFSYPSSPKCSPKSLIIDNIRVGGKLPIIGMSASSDTVLKAAAIYAGMTVFLVKPFTANQLFVTIQALDSIKLSSSKSKDDKV